MYSVLIVDDEKKICQLIHKLINWKALNLELCDIVQSAGEALEVFSAKKPDIVITDIRMPEVDGLQMIRQMREINLETSIIVISGYRDFEYARQAIGYGVEEYLLKPIKKTEVNSTLERIIAKLEEQKMSIQHFQGIDMIQNAFVSNYIRDYKKSKIVLSRDVLSQIYHWNCPYKYFTVIIVKFDDKSKNQEDYTNYTVKKFLPQMVKLFSGIPCSHIHSHSAKKIIFFVNHDIMATDLRNKLRLVISGNKLNEIPMFTTLAMGKTVDHPENIWESVEDAERLILDRVVLGTERIIYEKVQSDITVLDVFGKEAQEHLRYDAPRMTVEEAFYFIDCFYERLDEFDELSGLLVIDLSDLLVDIFISGFSGLYPSEVLRQARENYNSRKEHAESVRKISKLIKDIIDEIYSRGATQENNIKNQSIADAKQYIMKNYNKQIGLNDVAEAVDRNPAYLSSAFKREMGVSVVDYLVQVRCDMAKEMLLKSKMTIRKIAEEVGYEDEKYFSRVFKRTSGMSPKEYRKLYY